MLLADIIESEVNASRAIESLLGKGETQRDVTTFHRRLVVLEFASSSDSRQRRWYEPRAGRIKRDGRKDGTALN